MFVDNLIFGVKEVENSIFRLKLLEVLLKKIKTYREHDWDIWDYTM